MSMSSLAVSMQIIDGQYCEVKNLIAQEDGLLSRN